MKTSKFLKLLLVITLLKGLIWAYITPPFQAPDEQNHFAYVQFVAETGRKPGPEDRLNTTLELITATKIINFDWTGNHPMWSQKNFTNAQEKEGEIRNISPDDRKNFVFYANGFKNPPLYYFLAATFYKIAQFGSIFERLYLTRALSVLFAVLAVYFSYKIAYLITGKKILSLTLAALVSFEPSFTFITSTVTNDSMAIISVTIAVFAILKNYWLGIFGGFLALLTRVHLGIILFYAVFKKFLPISIPFLIILFLLAPLSPDRLPFNIDKYLEGIAYFRILTLSGNIFPETINFMKTLTPHYLNEVLPWYLGVFGWLEITLPVIIYTIFKLLIFFSILGFVFKRKNPYPKIAPAVISAGLLFLIIILFDFITFVQNGSGAGVQGRHLIPAVSVHFLLLIIGLELIIPEKFHLILKKVLLILMISINFIGILLILDYFYGFNYKWFGFYKPSFIPPAVFFLSFILYLLFLLHFLYSVGRLKRDE